MKKKIYSIIKEKRKNNHEKQDRTNEGNYDQNVKTIKKSHNKLYKTPHDASKRIQREKKQKVNKTRLEKRCWEKENRKMK